MTEPAWLADPTGRHQTRYWNGSEWTHHVADHGVVGVDPPPPPPPPMAMAPPPPFVAPTPHVPASTPQPASKKWWIVVVPIVVLALIAAAIASRDSKKSSSSGGVGASSGGVSGKSVRVEFTDARGYQYVVEHTGAVHLQRSIADVSPGFEMIHAAGGKVSVVNANSGRNAPMPFVQLLVYVPVPECDKQDSVFVNPHTEVSLPESCYIESSSAWSTDADIANGLGSVDNLDRLLEPGQTAVAAVDDSWFEDDVVSAVPDTVDVSGPFVWGIEVSEDNGLGTETCVIRLVGSDPALVQELIDSVAQVDRSGNASLPGFDAVNCDVAPA